jgi:Nucleotide-sugar transporter
VAYTLVSHSLQEKSDLENHAPSTYSQSINFLFFTIEKILKGSRTSLWIRNVQMGLPSVLIAYITVYFKDAAAVRVQGFLGGYNATVWTVIIVQAVGGLIVATVVKVWNYRPWNVFPWYHFPLH